MGVQPATEGPAISRDNPEHALGRQLLPTIRTQTKAQAAHAALVHQIISALRSALVRRLGNQGSDQPRGKSGNTPPRTREAAPSGPSHPTQHGTRMPCPLRPVSGSGRAPHRRLSAPPKLWRLARGPSKNRGATAADMRRDTAAHTWHGPHGGHQLMGRQRGTLGTTSFHQRP